MAFRNDITINWSVSPRIITVAAPSTTVSLQDLDDTLRNLEAALPTAMQFPFILNAAGKNDLGGGLLVGITLTLQNAQLAFAARAGPSFIKCSVSGGNLVAVDSAGVIIDAISPAAFTWVLDDKSTSAALIVTASGAGADWTDTEKQQIRQRLGLDGATVSPAATPSLATFDRQLILTAAERTAIANAMLDLGSAVDGLTLRQIWRIILAIECGKTSGVDVNAPKFRDTLDTKNRVSATTDASGNRTSVTLDPS